MAGAGKKAGQPACRDGQQGLAKTTASKQTIRLDLPSAIHPPGGFDGPSDTRSSQGRPAHSFGPAFGFDPARDNPGPPKPQLPTRLELPSDAYRDLTTQYVFPHHLPLRPAAMNTQGKAIQVRVNQFKVAEWPQKTVYQYDIHIGSGAEKRGLIRAVWNSRTLKERLKAVDGQWLFDGNKIAWCATKVPGEMRTSINLDQEKGRPLRIDPATGQPLNTVRVVVKLVGEIRMAVIQAYLEKRMQFDNTVLEAINFLDHCMRQWPMECYTQIKRSFFARGCKCERLDDVIEAMTGVYSSIRLCQPLGSTGASTGLAVNVDVANGTFWTPQPLHQAVRNYCKDRNRNRDWLTFRNLLQPVKDGQGWAQSRDFKELRKVAGARLRFTVKHRGKENESKIYTIKSFCWDPKFGQEGAHAKNVKFMLKDKKNPNAPPKEISVYDYFVKQYNINLQYWYLPLVKTEKDGTFPMEVCDVVPNQQYKYKCDPNQTAAMIKFAVTRPKDRMKTIKDGIDMLKWHEDPYLRHFGVKIEPNMTITNARLLQNPEVGFNGAKASPGTTGRWDLRGKKFFRANTQALKSWGVCVLEDSVDSPTLQNFLKTFVATYIGHGGVVETRSPLVQFPAVTVDLAEAVQTLRKSTGDQFNMEPQILLFILKDKNSVTYERLKKNMDCRWGNFSQMLQSVHVKRAQPQYCSNVCMKLNAKLGGATSYATGKDVKSSAKFFTVPTMIIGADVSHASPGSPQASMAAITMSMDKEACRYAAQVQTNGHRVEMITTANIRSMMMPLFNHWVNTVGMGRGPSHIYYFRDGVSEGQYAHVLEQEVNDMKKAIKEKYGDVNIKFTVTVASKRHHLRFFPKDGDAQAADKNGNALPGTLVERDITHPFEYDFYLCSHSAIQGTARPTHYHVLLDEANVPTNDFQRMIYQHCYQYMRSTTPVSLYPAVYYAHLASNRARAHEDVASSLGPRGGQKFVEQQQDAAILAAARGIAQPSVTASIDRHTEARPLLQLGAMGSANAKLLINTGMWYI